MALNLADQKGPKEPAQIAVGLTFTGAVRSLLDTDKDGVKDNRDREMNTPLGYPVNSFGVALDTDGDGVPDGHDKQPKTPKGCKVDANGVALDSDGDGVPNSINKEPNSPKGYPVTAAVVAIIPQKETVSTQQKETVSIQQSPYSIQVSSYRSARNADRDVSLYKKRGYEALKVLTNIPGMGAWYRVYVGHYTTASEARQAAQVIKKRGYVKTHALRNLKSPLCLY